MTVTYDDRLTRLFFYWRASVWQLVWKDLLTFCVLFTSISCLYRFGLTESQRETFEMVVERLSMYSDSLIGTVSFLLGFFVNAIVSRWWTQFELLPWPEELMNAITFCMPEQDTQMRLVRRTVARYFCLTTALSGRLLSTTVINIARPYFRMTKRFPLLDDVVKAGLMTDQEVALYKSTAREVQFYVPMLWAQQILATEAKKRDVPAPHSSLIGKEISECITRFRKLFCYDWVNIPLVYTQCVAFAVYVYFAASLIGKQFIQPKNKGTNVDYYIPVFVLLQLVFYIGWFRVGLRLMKPFGDDAEDFEVNTLLDRHIEVAFELADAPSKPLPVMRDLAAIIVKNTGVGIVQFPPVGEPDYTQVEHIKDPLKYTKTLVFATTRMNTINKPSEES